MSNETQKTSNFVHFRTQSSYSMLESTIKIADLVNLATKNNMPAIALTDKSNLFGCLEFSIAATKASIQPICGAILNILYTHKGENKFAEILIIAKDETGYQNLLKLSSFGFIKNDRTICNHITFTDLETHSDGLIVLSGYVDGIIGQLLLAEDQAAAKDYSNKLLSIFNDRFYFEIMRHGKNKEGQEDEIFIEKEYLNIATELKIPLLATNKVLFNDASMHDAHDVLLCISEGVVREQTNRKKVSNHCYFKSAKEMEELFSDLPEAIENTGHLAKRCYVMANSSEPNLPNFLSTTIKDNKLNNEEDLIRSEANTGLETKLQIKFEQENIPENERKTIREEYLARLEFELGIICKMNFSGYFLIVSDFIKWSKKNGIAVGPGRGSGAGSIIAWVLEITDLDPIKFGLLFERFLNPERVSMPDFDVDFCQRRREEVINYVMDKYGHDKVGQIITFGKMQAKAVIKDVARVLGLKYYVAKYLSELVPFNAVNPVTLSQAINDIAELSNAAKGKGLYNLNTDSNEDIEALNELISQVLSTALSLEGLHRHASIHAAGIVIANKNLIETVPVYKDELEAKILTVQYSMKYCELSGLIKFDFLGLQTLTVITNCCKLLETQGINIDVSKIPLNNKKTFSMLSKGLSTGVFQFESVGMKNALRNLQPDDIVDIIALGALYRPGPMDNIPTYIACKHGRQKADYLHPLLKTTLKETYGVIIYQEQVMEIAKVLAGYTLGSADLLRKAMGKKVKAEMDAQEEIFIKGAVKNNVNKEQAKAIFATVAKFAGYGFNKSHASAYGVISYQTAYLKANHPVEFLVASLNLELDNSDKIIIFLQEAKNFNIPIISPCINQSQGVFDIKQEIDKDNNPIKSIIFAIGAIKNVTQAFGDKVAKERLARGKFKSIIDFVERIEPKLVNRRCLESLIKSGAFDSLHENRQSLLNSLPRILAYATSYYEEQQDSHQMSLISVNANSGDVIITAEKPSNSELAFAELESMGVFIKYHPLSQYQDIFETKGTIKNSLYLNKELEDGSHFVTL
ncbi:MAG: DNA polymerase III subunit alpha, partial [Rickettsiaceae bacterium]|nr:DNA polymerase III subunit alpha [Rickettsiaceae bacterium]